MKLSKVIARKFVFPVLMGLKVDKLMQFFSRPRILFVMYHGVVKEDRNYFSPRHLVVDQFEKQLNYISNNFDMISLEDAFYLINNKIKIKRHTLVITFDDGYENNLKMALPIIDKYKIPTTIFVSSLCATDDNKKYLWSEAIAALKYFYKDEVIEIDEFKFVNLYDPINQINLMHFLKHLPYDKRDETIKYLEDKYDLIEKINQLPSEIWRLMSKDELLELSKSKFIKIGTHGHLHYNLGHIDKNIAEMDIRLSKGLIENVLNVEVDAIAYPDGSYNQKIKDFSEELGLKYQLAVPYLFEDDKNDFRIMNRHGISSGTTFESNMFFLNRALISKGVNPI